jgi:hypothetical protein
MDHILAITRDPNPMYMNTVRKHGDEWVLHSLLCSSKLDMSQDLMGIFI